MAVLGVGTVLLGLRPAGPAEAAERVAGYVVTVEGHGGDRRGAGEGRSIPLEVRGKVSYGDRLITQEETRVQLFLWGTAVFVLGPDSQLELPAPGRGAREQVLRMGPGFFRLLTPVGARGARLLVMTPTAVTSVRGAEILGEVGESHTAMVVIRGEVEVRGAAKGGTIRVRAGQGTDVAAGQDPTEPVEWEKERLERLRAATTVKLLW
ncbi:MAG TPA: hypothetical protein VLG48_07625 [Candidatus Methylomirabilis sp.]|nr:hypothetical protein [Candidatus Methylomirabilis sp.]